MLILTADLKALCGLEVEILHAGCCAALSSTMFVRCGVTIAVWRTEIKWDDMLSRVRSAYMLHVGQVW
jgi:hypothetical protein